MVVFATFPTFLSLYRGLPGWMSCPTIVTLVTVQSLTWLLLGVLVDSIKVLDSLMLFSTCLCALYTSTPHVQIITCYLVALSIYFSIVTSLNISSVMFSLFILPSNYFVSSLSGSVFTLSYIYLQSAYPLLSRLIAFPLQCLALQWIFHMIVAWYQSIAKHWEQSLWGLHFSFCSLVALHFSFSPVWKLLLPTGPPDLAYSL